MTDPLPVPVDLDAARQLRDASWRHHRLVPPQYAQALDRVSLDRYWTAPIVAERCVQHLFDVMISDHAPIDDYIFIEPSAGAGAFLQYLPRERTIALDIAPMTLDITAVEYLSWSPPDRDARYAVVGNPPFGRYGWAALAFMQHAASMADYVGFILPYSFVRDTGQLYHQVRGAELITETAYEDLSFQFADGPATGIGCVWQIWRRGVNNPRPLPTCDDYIELLAIHTDLYCPTSPEAQTRLDLTIPTSRDVAAERIAASDLLLQDRFFPSTPVQIETEWSAIRVDSAHGIRIKRDHAAVAACLRETDWSRYSNVGVNRSRTITRRHVALALIDAGFIDPAPSADKGETDEHLDHRSQAPRGAG